MLEVPDERIIALALCLPFSIPSISRTAGLKFFKVGVLSLFAHALAGLHNISCPSIFFAHEGQNAGQAIGIPDIALVALASIRSRCWSGVSRTA